MPLPLPSPLPWPGAQPRFLSAAACGNLSPAPQPPSSHPLPTPAFEGFCFCPLFSELTTSSETNQSLSAILGVFLQPFPPPPLSLF